jgi:hypothetical protein
VRRARRQIAILVRLGGLAPLDEAAHKILFGLARLIRFRIRLFAHLLFIFFGRDTELAD